MKRCTASRSATSATPASGPPPPGARAPGLVQHPLQVPLEVDVQHHLHRRAQPEVPEVVGFEGSLQRLSQESAGEPQLGELRQALQPVERGHAHRRRLGVRASHRRQLEERLPRVCVGQRGEGRGGGGARPLPLLGGEERLHQERQGDQPHTLVRSRSVDPRRLEQRRGGRKPRPPMEAVRETRHEAFHRVRRCGVRQLPLVRDAGGLGSNEGGETGRCVAPASAPPSRRRSAPAATPLPGSPPPPFRGCGSPARPVSASAAAPPRRGTPPRRRGPARSSPRGTPVAPARARHPWAAAPGARPHGPPGRW
jgi:hypothetical protein